MKTKSTETVCIVGAGFMGTQIGLQCATHGHDVWFVDSLEESLQRAVQRHSQELGKRFQIGQISLADKEVMLNRIHYTTKLLEGASNAGFAIESVPEHLESKRSIFAQLDDGENNMSGIIKKFTDPEYDVISGLKLVEKALQDFPNKPELKVLDILNCEGGCISGPGMVSKESLDRRRQKIISHWRER